MTALEQYFHVVLVIMLCKMVLAFKSVDETLVCNHSKMKAIEQCFRVVLFIFHYLAQKSDFVSISNSSLQIVYQLTVDSISPLLGYKYVNATFNFGRN